MKKRSQKFRRVSLGKIQGASESVEIADSSRTKEVTRMIKLDQIVLPELLARHTVDDKTIESLLNTMNSHGQIHAIVVRPVNGKYELVSGLRRFLAAKKGGWDGIQCAVKNMDAKTSRQIALIENIQREDLNAIEEARGLQQLIKDGKAKDQASLAQMMGVTKQRISQKILLLKLPEEIQKQVLNNPEIARWVSARHLGYLLKLPKEKAIEIFKETVSGHLRSDAVKSMAKKYMESKGKVKQSSVLQSAKTIEIDSKIGTLVVRIIPKYWEVRIPRVRNIEGKVLLEVLREIHQTIMKSNVAIKAALVKRA